MNNILVSVYCLAYNHEKYIQRALEGFISQKTNFEYEVIVHDDASTDGTANIIRRYAEKYPKIIKPIFQSENQHSKGIPIVDRYIYPIMSGKYVASCEGDDYWCDNRKLQIQFDYMEHHPECSLCGHNTIFHDLNGVMKDSKFHNWSSNHVLNDYEVFMCWKIHLSSFFYRIECLQIPEFARGYWFGDYVRVTLLHAIGDIVVFPQIMSVYNYGVKTGVLFNVDHAIMEKKKQRFSARADYLKEYDKETNGKYHEIICKRILAIQFEVETLEEREIITHSTDRKIIGNSLKAIRKSKWFWPYFKSIPIKSKFKIVIVYYGNIFFNVWIKMCHNRI